MVAIGRALMANPALLLCDEISLGLAPIVIAEVYRAMPAIRESGTAIIVVEQDIAQVMRIADRLYCLREGRVVLQGAAKSMDRHEISQAYFGALA
jgi:branched-chain amino acid transport system ATP-binding protein